MQTDSQHDYSSLTWSFESGKGGKERKKAQEIEYLENEKSFLIEIEPFYNFWNAFFWKNI